MYADRGGPARRNTRSANSFRQCAMTITYCAVSQTVASHQIRQTLCYSDGANGRVTFRRVVKQAFAGCGKGGDDAAGWIPDLRASIFILLPTPANTAPFRALPRTGCGGRHIASWPLLPGLSIFGAKLALQATRADLHPMPTDMMLSKIRSCNGNVPRHSRARSLTRLPTACPSCSPFLRCHWVLGK